MTKQTKQTTSTTEEELFYMDEEMKALLKAFATDAIEKGINITRACKMLRHVWHEVNPKQKDTFTLEKEDEDELKFREKAKQEMQRNISNLERYKSTIKEISYEDGEKTDAVLEMMCVMYKMFKNPMIMANPMKKDLVEVAKQRLRAIGGKKFVVGPQISEAYDLLSEEYGYKCYTDKMCSFLMNYNFGNSLKRTILFMIWHVLYKSEDEPK